MTRGQLPQTAGSLGLNGGGAAAAVPRTASVGSMMNKHWTHWSLSTALTLSERQSARMSKITNDGLTQSDTGCFIAAAIWQQWARQRVKHKKVRQPYNVADARHVNFPQIRGGVPQWGWALVVLNGRHRVPKGRLYKTLRYLSRFCSSFELIFLTTPL